MSIQVEPGSQPALLGGDVALLVELLPATAAMSFSARPLASSSFWIAGRGLVADRHVGGIANCMIRASLMMLAIACSITFVACSDRNQALPSPTATTTQSAATVRRSTPVIPENVAVEPPRPASDALTEASFEELHRYFVIDLSNGLVQPLGFAAAFSSQDPIVWLDEDTLWLDHPDAPLELDLDGTVRVASSRSPDSDVKKRGGDSASGAWSVAQLASGAGGAIFSPGQAQPARYRIANALGGVWSPTRDVALLIGNWCAGFDLFLFDPETVVLTNLTASDDRSYRLGYAWAPDGIRIAAAVGDAGHDALVMIDTGTKQIATLAEAAARADVRPLAWSPSGQRLLFYAWHGQESTCLNPPYQETYLDTVPNLGGP